MVLMDELTRPRSIGAKVSSVGQYGAPAIIFVFRHSSRAPLGGYYYRNRSNNRVLGNVPCYWYVIYITVL